MISILQACNLHELQLESMQCYPESLWTKVGKRVSQSLDIEETTFYEGTGTSFIDFGKIRNLVICRNFIKPEKIACFLYLHLVIHLNFDRLLFAIGRDYRDFVTNLDNFHHFINKKFPNMKAPSYFVESESPTGEIFDMVHLLLST